MFRELALQFDRPGWRGILTAALPIAGRLSPIGVREIPYEDGWVHRFGDSYVVEFEPRLRAPELTSAWVKDYCCQLYEGRPGDTVVDVGAGFGWETIYFARRVSKVIPIEAQPSVAAALKRTIALNDLANVEIHNLAIADKP